MEVGASSSSRLDPPTEDALLLRIYKVGLMARAVDERLWILSRQGRAGFVLTARGHEVAQIASAAAFRRGRDSAWLYYRDLAVGLALGVTAYELFLGAMGRADDPHSGGRQLSAHLSSPRLGIGSVSSAVGAHLPHAVGAAWAARVKGADSVALCWFGDGASSEGAAHESMNLAGVHRLPVVFICENNGWAISVPLPEQMAVDSVADRAQGYGMFGVTVDGTDALAVFQATHQAVERARSGGGASLLDLAVPRIGPHSSQDDDAYRTDQERDAATARDPLPRLRTLLLERRVIGESDDRRIVETIADDVLAAQERALIAREPEGSRARQWLFAGDAAHSFRAQLDTEPLAPGVFDE